MLFVEQNASMLQQFLVIKFETQFEEIVQYTWMIQGILVDLLTKVL